MAWAIHHLPIRGRQELYVPMGLGAIGSALCAAIGAGAARPDRPVVALVGDCAMMHGTELLTAGIAGFATKVIVLNDGGRGMVDHGMALLGMPTEGLRFPRRVDFAAFGTRSAPRLFTRRISLRRRADSRVSLDGERESVAGKPPSISRKWERMLEETEMSGSEATEEHLANQLSQECASLIGRLDTAVRVEDLEGAFASFFGSFALDQLQAVSRRSVGKGRRLKRAIRDQLAPLYRRSGVWRHCIERPFGYPGDYSILEHVYDQSAHPKTQDDVGKLIDRWSISTGLPVAVGARKDALRLHLQELAEGLGQQGKVAQVLSIACGGAREIRELPERVHPHLELTLLDRDPVSLRFATEKLSAFQRLRFRTVAADAVLAEPGTTTVAADRKYDLIYSFGLFDYLADHQLVQCLNNFTPLLAADGCFAFCLKDHRHYDSLFYDLLLDWRFVPRTREDAGGLVEQAKLKIIDRMTVKGMAVNIYFCRLDALAGASMGARADHHDQAGRPPK